MGGQPVDRARAAALARKGVSNEEIARAYGVTPQAISWQLRHAGVPVIRDSERRRLMLPWAITGGLLATSPVRELIYHLEYQENPGMSDAKKDRLRKFYKRLAEFSVVLRYDPELPPMPGRKYGGFEYVARTDADEDLILRVDDNTPVTDRAKWRIPPQEKWPE